MKLKELEKIVNEVTGKSAAASGRNYESKLALKIQQNLLKLGLDPDSFTIDAAGFGPVSDITVYSKSGKKILSIEAKTGMGAEFGQAGLRFNIKNYQWELSPSADDDAIKIAMADAAFNNSKYWKSNVITFEPWEIWYYKDFLKFAGPSTKISFTIPSSGITSYQNAALDRINKEDKGKKITVQVPGSIITGLKSVDNVKEEQCFIDDADGQISRITLGKMCDIRDELRKSIETFWGLTKEEDPSTWSGISNIEWDAIKDKYAEKGDMFIQVGKGQGMYALNKKYQWNLDGTKIPLWQDQAPTKSIVRFRLKSQGSTYKDMTFKLAQGLNLGKAQKSPIDLDKDDPNTQQFYQIIADMINKSNRASTTSESLTKSKITYKMLEQMVEEAIKKAR